LNRDSVSKPGQSGLKSQERKMSFTGEFEPKFPDPYKGLFSGTFGLAVTDPQGIPSDYIISMTDQFRIAVNWKLQGALVRCIGLTWTLNLFLERFGPGIDLMIWDNPREKKGQGESDFSVDESVDPRAIKDLTPGAYRLIAVLTAKDLKGGPAPFAAYCEGPILQFFAGPSLP
jgi:hypothetical protein